MKRLVILIGLSILLSSCKKDDVQKPNIVFILIDDMGCTDVGFMGAKYYETPNIDRLAKNGMVFTRAYANAANCAPTRACLLSGQYTPRHGVFTVANSDRGKPENRRLIPIENNETLPLDKITIAEALKPAGYTSAAIGKWHVGNSPQLQGFDVGMERGDLGYPRGHFKDDGEYLTDRLTDEAIKFITENKEKPFFLYLAHHAVHTPIQAKKEKTEKYEEKETEECHSKAEYAAMIESVDESVSKINQTLDNLNLSENTILIFFSDNGGHGTYTCQKPLRGGKGMYYEGGIREPMFAYWPGKIKAGTTCNVPVISTDFYPTFLEIANAPKPENYILDGKSIVPLLKEEKSFQRDALFWHFPGYLEAYNGLMEDARDITFRTRPVSVIQKNNWKLLVYYEEWMLDGGRENIASNHAVELYNLAEDISESNNLCNSEIEIRDELLDELLSWIQETKAAIPQNANPEFVSKL
ncbi:MAG: sulfatase [Draconibacterium sp.]